MGTVMSCMRKKKDVVSAEKPIQQAHVPKPKHLVLDKDRKIIQKDNEIHQIVFDVDGFSVHDLALVGQNNCVDSLMKVDLKPMHMGRVKISPNIFPRLSQKPAPGTSSKGTSETTEEFEIVEVQEYIDDLYLQMLDPKRFSNEDRKDTTSADTKSK